MKRKLKGVLGIALTLVILASLTVSLAGAPAGAASSNLKFVKLELPKVEDFTYDNPVEFADSEGDFWCTPGVDLGPIARTPDGGILFAAVADGKYMMSNWFHVLKSTDGGYSWTATGFWEAWWGDIADLTPDDGTPIVDIVTSPEYGDDTTLAVASRNYVYVSDDGGKTFVKLDAPWSTATINDIDVTIAEDGDLALMVGANDGDVYVAKGLLSWTPQLIPGAISTNVLACKFLPTFADDGNIGLSAIVTNTVPDPDTTTMTFSFANIRDGGEWGDDIANAPFTNASGIAFGSEAASIAFPDDFDAFGVGNNVCFAGIVQSGSLGEIHLDTEDGSDAYKVVCKEAGTSSATDLDVRGVLTTLLPTATAITSIDVCGDAESATILVGTDAINLGDTPTYWSAYISDDSGDSWVPSMKCPTGGADYWYGDPDKSGLAFFRVNTRVMMGPDFCSDGLAYASTWGWMTDAFQRTTDGGESFNQISIIDYGSGTEGYAIIPSTGFNPYGYNADGTLWMITQVDSTNGALWGRLDGNHWERILSYATPGVTDTLKRLDILGDGSAMFATDLAKGLIWRSTDMGATFLKKITTKMPLTTVAPVSATTLYTGSTGEIWWSTRSGTGWTKPDDSEIPASAAIINIGVAGDIVLVGAVGGVYISSNGGDTVEKVGTDSPFGGATIATKDLGFAGNGILYAVSPGSPDVMRTAVDLDNPHDAEWIKIDDYQDSTGGTVYNDANFAAGGPAITLPMNGILYVADASPVNKEYTSDTGTPLNAGGLWRSVNPTFDTDGAVPPYFERENHGLDDYDMVGFLGADLKPPTLAPTFFFGVSNYGDPEAEPPGTVNQTPYYDQVVMFTDILNVGVGLVIPEADATGVGLLPENMVGDVYPVVTFAWDEMPGATGYQYQVSIDPDFKTRVLSAFTGDLGVIVDNRLLSNTTYYWRVRVADEGSLIGAPLISPWSPTYKFKTAIGPTMQRPLLQAPLAGELDVPLSPTFEWSGIEWAEVYEYELALDPATTAGGYFSTPLVALVGANSLVSTAWKCDITLDYSTRYYWHVKAIGVDTDTPWSDVGTFTTMGVPPAPPTTQPPVVIPPAENITPAWIWAIVIIGAILVIAVIVLIVTTRRVP
jgi:hypothetical protein